MQRVLSFPNSRGFGDPSEFVSKRMCFSFMFSLGFLAFLAGFLLGRFAFDRELELSRNKLRKAHQNHQQVFGTYKNYSQFDAGAIADSFSSDSLQRHLIELSNDSNSESNSLREAKIIQKHLQSSDFDLIAPLTQSVIHLSYPDPSRPNQISVLNDGKKMFVFNDSRPKFADSAIGKDFTLTSVTVEGSIVYVNFGRNEDYHYLDSFNIGVSGSIVLARAGRIVPMDMVECALEHDAKGIIIYLDPQQKDVVLPLLSFVDLAKLQKFHGNGKESVPVLIISASDAERILKEMSSNDPSPDSWRGDLESSYPIGPGFSDPSWRTVMQVNTINVVRQYYDMLGAIRGSQEPDRFVMLANERNPWASNGNEQRSTAMILEVIRVLGDLKKNHSWRPHRSVVVASWGLGGPEQHFSSHPENWWSQLEMKTVAYLRVDPPIPGNRTVSPRGTPILEKTYQDAVQTVNLNSPELDVMLQIGSDSGLVQHGVPFLELQPSNRYINETVEKLTKLWGVLTWNLADSHALPFSLNSYVRFFNHSINVIEDKFRIIAQKQTLFLDKLLESVNRLISTIGSFQDRWSHADKSKSIEMRIMNDQLLRFIHSLICPSDDINVKHSFRHMIFSQSTTGSDPTAGFGVLQDLFRETTSAYHSDDLHQHILTHLSGLVECIDAARYTLTDGLEAFVLGQT